MTCFLLLSPGAEKACDAGVLVCARIEGYARIVADRGWRSV